MIKCINYGNPFGNDVKPNLITNFEYSRLLKIEKLEKLWSFFDSLFSSIKCDMFYQKEKKIQIKMVNLKKENYPVSRKRKASSDSGNSETPHISPRSSPSPGNKLKLKKIKKDPQTSSIKSTKSPLESKSTNNSSVTSDRKSPSTSLVSVSNSTNNSPQPMLSPSKAQQPMLSPTKSQNGKKVPIYHNAHKIFRAQQIARQIMSRDSDTVTMVTSVTAPVVSSVTTVVTVASVPRTSVHTVTTNTKHNHQHVSRSLADASKLQYKSTQQTYNPPSLAATLPVAPLQVSEPPSAPPILLPQLSPMRPVVRQQLEPAPPVLQPVISGKFCQDWIVAK